MVNLDAVAIHVIINIIILSPVLWVSGRLLAGKERAKFTDALWISILGTVIGDLLGVFTHILRGAGFCCSKRLAI